MVGVQFRKKPKRDSKVEVDVTMRGEVKVNQFDILFFNREHTLPEQFPLRVTFLADASKNVAAKCEKKQIFEQSATIQTVDTRFDELCRGIGRRKRFQSISRSKRIHEKLQNRAVDNSCPCGNSI